MSAEHKVMVGVASMMSFIKDSVKTDLQAAKLNGLLNVDDNTLERACNIVVASIESSFVKSSSEVSNIAKKLKS